MSEASRHILVPKSQPWTSQRVLPHHSKAKRVERLPHTMKAHRLSVLWRIALLLIGSNSARLISGQAHSCYSNSECGSGASCVAGDSSTRVQFCVADPPCGGTTVGNCPVDAPLARKMENNAMVEEAASHEMATFPHWLVRATLDGWERFVRQLWMVRVFTLSI
ncbi:hypothetical protein ABG067_006030 [Albugo candida]